MSIDDDPLHHARRTDPSTSHEAAEKAPISAECERLLPAYADGEAIDGWEAHRRVGFVNWLEMDTHRRTYDLKAAGLIEDAGKHISARGRRAVLRRITPEGLKHLGISRQEREDRGTEAHMLGTVNGSKPIPPAVDPSKRRRKAVNIESTEPAERGCDHCPLQAHWPNLKTPRMKIDGYRDAEILIIGEAPGREEDYQGKPFVGEAGRTLHKILPGRQSDRIATTNAVRCRPPDNRNPSQSELHACSELLEGDLRVSSFRAILGLGSVPLGRFIGPVDSGAGITQIHGLKFPVEVAGKTFWYYPALHPSFVNRTGGPDSPAYPIFKNDLNNFFKNVDKWPAPKILKPSLADVVTVGDETTARALYARLLQRGGPIGLDIETSGLRPQLRDAEILTAAVSNGELTFAWPIRHPEAANDWGLPLLLDIAQSLRWIAHNAAFELAWLRENSEPELWYPEAGFDDSMAVARLYQRRETALNLGILSRLYLGVNIKALSPPGLAKKIREQPLADVLPYNGLDAWASYKIFAQLVGKVRAPDYDHLLSVIEATAEMQRIGLDVDSAAVDFLAAEWEAKAAAFAEHARSVYEVRKWEAQTGREFNLASPAQVGDALVTCGRVALPRNGRANSYKTDIQTLQQIAPDNPLVRDALGYRHAAKMLSTYVEPLMHLERFVDGRIHPSYTTMLTRTFRLSSEYPNIQNFPKRRDRELRSPIVPPPGHIWASADYGQLEARVYAMASRDRALVESIIAEEDIHRHWLEVILDAHPPYFERLARRVTPNDTEEQVLKGGRDLIKADFVFSSFYGSGIRSVVERTGLPMDVAGDVLGDFWARYHGAAQWLDARRKEYQEYGISRNLLGVPRYGIMSGNEPINNPIQGTAARLVNDAMCDLFALYRKHGDPCMLPRIHIHDDLTFALPDDDELLVVYIREISRILTRVRYPFQIVPLSVEWRIGSSWDALYPVRTYTGDYVR
ncbi:MAG: hypothetical protein J2P48_06890 [Alphaproteobacteria bacterium]|nr:hypothetical protein [Alphaproteobacteria bacterium]